MASDQKGDATQTTINIVIVKKSLATSEGTIILKYQNKIKILAEYVHNL